MRERGRFVLDVAQDSDARGKIRQADFWLRLESGTRVRALSVASWEDFGNQTGQIRKTTGHRTDGRCELSCQNITGVTDWTGSIRFNDRLTLWLGKPGNVPLGTTERHWTGIASIREVS